MDSINLILKKQQVIRLYQINLVQISHRRMVLAG
nr:MAG TPA: hypothetical protein [Caudoviricetes sp.]